MKRLILSPLTFKSLIAITTGSLLLTLTQGLAQGTLTPPGAPAPTMRTLLQIEPRTPISSVPYSITNSGSYYLTTNFNANFVNGITITATNVTLDLNGFALQGPSNYNGITITGGANITVRNGSISGWAQGLSTTYQADTPGLVVERIRACGNNNGISISATGFVVRDCVCQSNLSDGIYGAGFTGASPGGTISGCTLIANKASGLECSNGTVKDCQIVSNGSAGMYAEFSQVSGCRIDSCGTNNTCYGIYAGSSDIRNCVIQNCVAQGIYAANSCRISDCVVFNSSFAGIQTVSACQINDCRVDLSSGIGINVSAGSIVHNCQVNNSGNFGIEAYSSTVSGCSVENSFFSGIYVNAPGCLILGNHLRGNNSSGNTSFNAGIYIDDANNRVEDNHVTASGYAGIIINANYSGNVVVKNYVQGNSGNNYLGAANNDFGPIGSAATVTSPWANISH